MDTVDPDHRRLEFLLVPQRHLDRLRVVDDVVVGQNVALIVDDKTRALALLRHRLQKEVAADNGRAGDVDHRW